MLEIWVSLWKLGSRDGMVSGSFASPASIVWIALLTHCMKVAWVSMSFRMVWILVVARLMVFMRLVLSFLSCSMVCMRSWSFSPRVVMVLRYSSMVFRIPRISVLFCSSWNSCCWDFWVGFPCWKMVLIFSRIRMLGCFLGVWFLVFGLLLPILVVV